MDLRLARLVVAGTRTVAVAVLGCVLALASDAGTTSYVYDVHGRLKTATTPNGTDQTVVTYTIDNAGNRSAVVVNLQDVTPPNPPTGLTASALAFDRIRVNWTPSLDVGGGPVSYYKIYRGGVHLASPNAPPFDDWPLPASTTYSYRVSAVDASGNESTQSASASATTLPGADLVAPSVPTSLQGTPVSGTRVDLTWGVSTDTGGSGLAGYEIFRDSGGTPIANSAVASYSDQTVAVASTHSYKVRAYDGAGNRSGFSNEIWVTTPDDVRPSAPGNPTFSAITGGTATANWTAATDNVGVTGYRYSLNSGASWTNVANTSANLTGLTLATTYTMLVQAGDAANNWSLSSSGSFTTSSVYTSAHAFTGGFYSDGQYGYSGFYPSYPVHPIGNLVPGTLSGGKAIGRLVSLSQFVCDPFDPSNCTFGGFGTNLEVVGFSGNPGAQWLQSLGGRIGLEGFTAATAIFSCNAGLTVCWWYWPTSDYVDLSGSFTLTIVHR